jgi:hypothetical protein
MHISSKEASVLWPVTLLFQKQASTTAQITDTTITSAPTVGVKALSSDRIDANAISGSAGVGAVNVAIALAETQNSTKANVQNSDITATNVNINAQNTSNLSSELEAVCWGGVAEAYLLILEVSILHRNTCS